MNEVENFEDKYLVTMNRYRDWDRLMKDAKSHQDEIKADLLAAMEQYNVKSIDNQYLKINRVAENTATTVDLKAFQKNEPAEYGQLLEDYPKVTKRKASLRITVK